LVSTDFYTIEREITETLGMLSPTVGAMVSLAPIQLLAFHGAVIKTETPGTALEQGAIANFATLTRG
jgi:hypothetical protein